MSNVNQTILQELNQSISDYFVITQEISKKVTSIEESNLKLINDKAEKNIDKENIIKLKKESFLYQFYNVMLVKVIANIRVLNKICQINGIALEDEKQVETIQSILNSDPDSMIVDGQEIVIIDDALKDIFENKLSTISDEEINMAMKASIENQAKNEKSK